MSVLAYTKSMPPWRAKLNFAGAFIVAFCAVIFAVSASWRAWGVPMYADLANVAHAAGGLDDGSTYVNGVDALDASYARGYRQFEMDFRRTTDGALVCSHDWDRDFGGEKPSFAQFSTVNAALTHKLCIYPSLVVWFKKHPDAVLITDAKEDVVGINKELRIGLGAQLMPTAYDLDSALALSEEGRYPVILAMYKMPDILSRYALVGSIRGRRIHVWAVAMSVTDVSNGLGYWSKLWIDAPVYSYLVNNCSPMFTLNIMGVDAVYSDDLAVRDCR